MNTELHNVYGIDGMMPILPFFDGEIKRIAAVDVYFCHRRYYAWGHLKHYYEIFCMHSNIESAKKYAESFRQEGTQVYIDQLPAIAFETEGLTLLATQIDNSNPLRRYRFKPKDKNPDALEIKKGVNLYSAFSSLHPYRHEYWTNPPSMKDSIICITTHQKLDYFNQLMGESLVSYEWTHYAGSTVYQWIAGRNHDKSAKAVRKLCTAPILSIVR